jgi:hypothetical protein
VQFSVDRLRSDYLDKLDGLEARMSGLEPVYRWPLPDGEVLHYECLYASGGGVVRATGGFPKTRQINDPKLCRYGGTVVALPNSKPVHRGSTSWLWAGPRCHVAQDPVALTPYIQ